MPLKFPTRIERPRSSLFRRFISFNLAGCLSLLLGGAVGMTQQIAAPNLPQAATPSGLTKKDSVTSPRSGLRLVITGKVVNSMSQSPVAKAEITVSPMGARRTNRRQGQAGVQNSTQATAITDAAGRFEIEVPSAAGWSVTAAARGFHTEAYEEHEGYSTAIILTETSPAYSMTFLLAPAATIEGFVLDEAGEPVRNAQLSLSLIPKATPEEQHPRPQGRGNQRTDDRGYYKFSGLLAGSYTMRVQAQPWYATGGSGFNRGGVGAIAGGISARGAGVSSGGAVSGSVADRPDPLDVVYPTVWYPGVTDVAEATPIMVRGGETHQADLRLRPVPGFHLRIPSDRPASREEARPDGGAQPAVRGLQGNTYLSQVLPDGAETGMPIALRIDPQGEMEYSGLAPGTYVLHRQGETADSAEAAETVHISANSARTLDLSQATPATPVTIKVDVEADQPSLQIALRDVESGRVSFARVEQRTGRGGTPLETVAPEAVPGKDRPPPASERTVNLQPGRYEVVLNGIGNLHLTRIEATGATATGRIVTIGEGAPVLTLHVAGGRANVTGFVRFHGKPDEGAMVLLIPATLGDPAGLDVTRRDQSNTDGSFDMMNVLPGAYILVAIDHGWDVNWSDPATLRSYLVHGLPLDLTHRGERSETIEARSP